MEAGARNVAALLIFILCSTTLASAFIFDDEFADLHDESPQERYHSGFEGGFVNDFPKHERHGFIKGEAKKFRKHKHHLFGNKNDGVRTEELSNQPNVDESRNGEGEKREELPKGEFQNEGGLRMRFYEESCPRAEEIVKEVVTNAVRNRSALAAGIVRLHSHDCFVKGCDASILLDKTPSGEKIEKLAPVNQATVVGFELIDEVKAQLEKECPGIVSCADILTFAARDSLALSGLPSYKVPGGRRDSLDSREVDVGTQNVPGPQETIENIIATFVSKGLTVEDMVVLIGAHSIGIAHCANFAYRVTLPNANEDIDPRLDQDIRSVCRGIKSKATMPFDSITQYTLDADFYRQLLVKKGLIESDQKIAFDPRTTDLVKSLAADQDGWFEKFSRSMIRMGNIGVLTGNQGEVRKQCRFVN